MITAELCSAFWGVYQRTGNFAGVTIFVDFGGHNSKNFGSTVCVFGKRVRGNWSDSS
jgi:hypothetical protein